MPCAETAPASCPGAPRPKRQSSFSDQPGYRAGSGRRETSRWGTSSVPFSAAPEQQVAGPGGRRGESGAGYVAQQGYGVIGLQRSELDAARRRKEVVAPVGQESRPSTIVFQHRSFQ